MKYFRSKAFLKDAAELLSISNCCIALLAMTVLVDSLTPLGTSKDVQLNTWSEFLILIWVLLTTLTSSFLIFKSYCRDEDRSSKLSPGEIDDVLLAVEEDILKPLSMSQRIRIKNKLVERGIM